MHLRSTIDQEVAIEKANLVVSLAAGETIWTESSYRFTSEEVVLMGANAGFECVAQSLDESWPFAQTLFAPTRNS